MYKITIPSYKRSLQLQKKTLSCLYNAGISKTLIDVFVIEDEYNDYLEKLNPDYYNNLIIGHLGLVQQREFIQNYYPIGTKIVSLDDDIELVDLSLTNYKTLNEFFEDAFKKCIEKGSYIWSVYPVFNKFFRETKKEITETLTFCIGAFYGYINRNDEDLKLKLTREGNKEDVERSILYWLKDGIMLRFNKIGFKTKYYGVGGLGGLKERIPIMKKDAIAINNAYPDITKIKVRKNGLYEIVFKLKKHSIQEIKNLGVICLEKIDPSREDIQELLSLLYNTTIPVVSVSKSGAAGGRARMFGRHRAMTLGITRGRFNGKYDLSYYSKKYKTLYEAIVNFGKSLNFDFNSIHINHNVVCSKHLDNKNVGKSLLVSFGDYEGCNLIIENNGSKEFNTNCSPIIFDGTKLEHYNTPLISGNKYSLVFYKTKIFE